MSNNNQKYRLKLLFILFFICSFAVFAKNFNLSFLKKIDRDTFSNVSKKPRGIIYDSKMRELAINVPAYTVYLDKEVVSNSSEMITISNVSVIYETLPTILNIDPKELEFSLSH